jgi:hypothetical protein
MSHLLTLEDIEHMDAHVDAAARGDAREALHEFVQTLQVEGSLTPHQLSELVKLGDDAPGWMYSRWCVQQAYRWMLHTCDRRTEDAVRQLMAESYFADVEQVADDPAMFKELGTRIAATDRLCEQLATFDYGGLADFLDARAGAGLVDRCDQVREWAEARMGGFVLERPAGPALRVRDLSLGAPLDVLNIGALTDRGSGTPVIGRVVPIDTAPGLMFESRPVSVDLQTAEDVAAASTHADPAFWITAIGDGRLEERLEPGFSLREGTLFSSDIVPMSPAETERMDALEPPGRLVELLDTGLDEAQANGVMVAEVALGAIALIGDDAAATVAPHVAAVIVERHVFEAMRQHCTSADNASRWQALAGCSTEPARSRCEELARLSSA